MREDFRIYNNNLKTYQIRFENGIVMSLAMERPDDEKGYTQASYCDIGIWDENMPGREWLTNDIHKLAFKRNLPKFNRSTMRNASSDEFAKLVYYCQKWNKKKGEKK